MFDFGDKSFSDDWLHKGAQALSTFWREEEACFLRTTGPALVEGGSSTKDFSPATGATSSNRSFMATTEILFFLAEEGRYKPGVSTRQRESLSGDGERWQLLGESLAVKWHTMANRYYSRSLEVLRKHSDNGLNDFTDAHLLSSASSLLTPFATDFMGHKNTSQRPNELQEFALRFEAVVGEYRGSRLADHGPTHPLLTLHSVRAVEVARHVTGQQGGRSRVADSVESMLRHSARDDILRQLGLHAAGDAEFDPAALLGDIALLHRFAGMSGRALVERGVSLLGEVQGFDGSWKTQILTGHKKLVWLPSLELSVSLANLVLADLTEGSDRLALLAKPILERSLEFFEAGYRETLTEENGAMAGWTNDQARQPQVVESWSTALAMQLLLRVRRISRRLDQFAILTRYRTTFREKSRREWLRWPDLAGPVPLVRSPEVEADRARRELRRISDPSPHSSLNRAIWTDIAEPVLRSPFDRPTQTASFVLYGPPGTRKSTMVSAIAAALDWPLVTLAPPDFLTAGLAGLEARAEEIFKDLLRLRRVVVFFDECEELFRRRTVVNSPEHRTQSDFITSGMLPRLQDLRDGKWVVFAIATNTELDELDPAVVRFGRVDGQQRVGHPALDAQLRYLEAKGDLSAELLESLSRSLVQYDDMLDSLSGPTSRQTLLDERRAAREIYLESGDLKTYFTTADRIRAREAEAPIVSFGVLDALARQCERLEVAPTQEESFDLITVLASGKGRPAEWTDVYGETLD